MTDQGDLPITRKCKSCGRRFVLEHMHQVETKWRPDRHSQWQVMCDGCAKSYSDFMRDSAAAGSKVPLVVVHGI